MNHPELEPLVFQILRLHHSRIPLVPFEENSNAHWVVPALQKDKNQEELQQMSSEIARNYLTELFLRTSN